tara:strand:- start:443 stop:706 length:264 start_codon:yes stop_codon:yes gene_type:complete
MEKIDKIHKWHSDPSHAWLEVKIKDLKKLNIDKDISNYSYINGDYAYLEEDCDASVYIKALEKKNISISYEEISYDKECFIRRYNHY